MSARRAGKLGHDVCFSLCIIASDLALNSKYSLMACINEQKALMWICFAQVDNHIAELTVRETLDFAARVLGVGHKAGV